MNRLLMYFLLFTAIVSSGTAGQQDNATLSGNVQTQITKRPIPYANILVKGTKLGSVADGSGHFVLPSIPSGSQVIVARAVGYQADEKKVVLADGKTVELLFELAEDPIEAEQVVITGTRTKHYIKDVPVRTEVVTQRELEGKNAGNVYEALDGVSGVRVEQQCQSCNSAVVRMQGLGAEHTQVLINGQPMYSGLAGVYGLQQFSTVDLERIEVVKGAGSALYGSSAVAGAINLVTRECDEEPSTTVDLQAGSYMTNRYSIFSSLRSNNVGVNIFALKLTGDVIDKTGEGSTEDEVKRQDGISDRVAQDMANYGFGLYVDGALMQGDKVTLRGKNISETRRGGLLSGNVYRNPFTEGTENIATDRYEGELSYRVPLSPLSELNLSAAYADHEREATNDSYLVDYLATHNDTTPELTTMRPYIADEHSLTATATYGVTLNSHSILAGVQVYSDKLEESGNYVVVDPGSAFLGESYESVSNKSAFETGAFVQDEWSITDRLQIVPGVRVDAHHSEESYLASRQVAVTTQFPTTQFDETSVSPRLAIKYDLTKGMVMRANVGTGFRAPYGFSEDLHLCSGSPRVWKSSALNPERSLSFNLSADYYGKTFQVSANLFRTELKNKIGFTDADPAVAAMGFDYQWKNIGDACVQGIELSAATNISAAVKLGLDFTYNSGEYQNARADWVGTEYEGVSKYISRFPVTTVSARLEYDMDGLQVTLRGTLQGTMYIDYYSEVETDSKIKKTDPYMLFGATASKQFGIVRLYAGAENIFNHVQDEKHLDDAAFMYAPVYGTMVHVGVAVTLSH